MAHQLAPSYNFAQQTLYSIAEDMYGSLADPDTLSAFADFKPTKYTPDYLTELTGRLTTAEEMPDDTQRNEAHETDKVQLITLNKTCARDFQYLKGYIHDAFPSNEWTIKYNAAGMVDNTAAISNNWNAVLRRNNKMNDFIAANATVLADDGHMPDTFQDKVTTDTGNFSTKHTAFVAAMHTNVGTGHKLTANNLVDADLKDLQNDAHVVYADDPNMLKLFMIEEVRLIVAPLGSASVDFETIEVGTNLPITSGTITIQSLTGVATSLPIGENGITKFERINPDRYSVTIQPERRPVINTTKDVGTGVNARMKVMVPAL